MNPVFNTAAAKRAWTPSEDEVLRTTIDKYGPQRWSMIADHLPGRMGKQCRERWFNHLCPEVKKSEWTSEEDAAIFAGVEQHGSRWCEIIKSIPGRTDNAIKNRYNSIIRRQKAAVARDAQPSQTKPSSPLGKRQWGVEPQQQSADVDRASVVALAAQLAVCKGESEQTRLIDLLAKKLQYRSPPSSPDSDSDALSDAESELVESSGSRRGFLAPLSIPKGGFAVESPPKRQRSSEAATICEPEALPVAICAPATPDALAAMLEGELDQLDLGIFADLVQPTPSPFTQLTNECLTPSTLGCLLLEESLL